MNSILKEDLESIINNKIIEWEKLKNKTIFITGATGLIGSIIVQALILMNERYGANIKLILLVRNEEEARNKFKKCDCIKFIVSSVEAYVPQEIKIDYMIHAASPTKSKYFVNNPTETLDIMILGTRNMLEQAKISKISSMVYLSSMEMYGTMNSDNTTEDMLGYINPLNVRSSYSEGKRICELYSYSYFSEYNLPIKIARIAQTFGAGISLNESRVYKKFADAVIKKEKIILNTEGSTKINYSYTTDTIIGVLCILLKGKNGEAYNVVGERTNMTIKDSAKWLADKYGENKVEVVIDIPKEDMGLAPNNEMILSNKKLKTLGWKCEYDLKQGYDRLINYLLEELSKNN